VNLAVTFKVMGGENFGVPRQRQLINRRRRGFPFPSGIVA
jgi:hypothetical protein